MKNARKGGRPPVPDANKAVSVTIERRHLEMLDEAILEDEGRSPEFIAAVAGDPHRTYEERQASQVAARRRQFLGELIERHCSFESRHPIEVRVHAPMFILGPAAETEAACEDAIAWMREQDAKLMKAAPEIIQSGIEHNKLERLRRSDPDAFARAVRDIVGRASDE